MKKQYLICVLFAALLALCGCQKQAVQTAPAPKKEAEKKAATLQEANPKQLKPQASLPKKNMQQMDTYQNNRYGFEFKYPKTWNFDKNNSAIKPQKQINCGGESAEEAACLDLINFEFVKNEKRLPIREFWQREYNWAKDKDYKDLTELNVGKVKAYRNTTISLLDGAEGESFWVPLSDGSFFVLRGSYLIGDEKQVFDDLVKSFKFIR